MIDAGIRETTNTAGTGNITLAAVAGYLRVADAFVVGEAVEYVITDGNNREWGIGEAGAGNTFTRDIIVQTLNAGVLTRGGAALTLSGSGATLEVTPHASANGGSSAFVDVGLVQRFVPHATNGSAMATLALTANRGYFMPFMCNLVPPVFTQMGIEVSTLTAGAAFVALFGSTLVSGKWRPGTRLAQTASLDTGTVGEKLTAALNIRLRANVLYWIAITGSSAATVRAVATGGSNAILGMTNAAITARTHIYATQAGAFGTDASALSYTINTGASPACLLVV